MHARRWNAYDALGQFEEIVGFYDQALAIARKIKDRRGEGNVWGNWVSPITISANPKMLIGILASLTRQPTRIAPWSSYRCR